MMEAYRERTGLRLPGRLPFKALCASAASLLLICGCTAVQPLPAGHDAVWAAALLLNPSSGADPGSGAALECLKSSLLTSYAFVDFKDSRLSDAQVDQDIHWKTIKMPALARMRRAEGKVWDRTHDPATVAAYHLSACMRTFANTTLREDSRWRQCLSRTEPAALISIYRYTGRPLPAAVDEVKARYEGWEPPGAVHSLALRIYLAPTRAADFRIREQLLGHCLAAGNG